MSGVTTFSLSLACSLRNWVILDYEEANGLTIRPWAPFLLYLFSFLFLCAQGHCAVASVIKDSISSSLSLMDGRVRFTSYAWPSIDREDKRTGVHHWWHFLFSFPIVLDCALHTAPQQHSVGPGLEKEKRKKCSPWWAKFLIFSI